MNSIRMRLLLLLTIGFAAAWIAAAWFTHIEAQKEVDKLFDAQLAQSAQVLLGTTSHELQERAESDDEGDDGKEQVVHEYEQKLAFQIWSGSSLLMRSTAAPSVAFANGAAGYSEVDLNEKPWRVFTRWDRRHEFMIQVAEPLARREELARHIAFRMLLPILIAFPVLALLIWFAVSGGLRPLQKLKQEVKQRAADRLEPVQMTGVPDEVAPLAQALNDLFARLRHAFESERQFTADAAHELRTPLAALKTQAQVAMRSMDETERRQALENVLRGVDRGARLVEQLLTLARVDPETAATGFEKLELRGLVTTVIRDLMPFAHTKKIELKLEDGLPGDVLGNSTQLDLLLRNLLDNAIRYTPEGGRVSVVVREENGVVLEVRDTGPGIPMSEREQVKQRFYRIAGSGQEGSGLGLSIVRRIVELHHAHMELTDNENGQGLTVKVSFSMASA